MFDLSNYPNDYTLCKFIFGSQYENIRYVFLAKQPTSEHCFTGQFDCRISLWIRNFLRNETFKNSVGLNIQINRILRPFIYRYYLPCIGSVLISSLSMTLPVTSLQGRVGISVTILLATINLYVTQMVRKNCIPLNRKRNNIN